MARAPQQYRPIDLRPVVLEIAQRAVQGLNATLRFTEERAQHHAPVRAIFRRDRRGNRPGQQIRTAKQFEAAREANPQVPMRQIIRPARVPLKQIRTLYHADALQSGLDLLERGRRFRGNTSSELPVIRQGRVTIAGDLRQVSGGRLVPVAFLRQIRGGKVTLQPPPARRNEPVSAGEFALSSRGRYEVRTGRATFRRAGTDRIGGSLKHSIRRIEATLTAQARGMIWGYVRAGNEDVDYARWQEVGNSHNRAHPFLRPALYESRGPFKENVTRALRGNRFRGR